MIKMRAQLLQSQARIIIHGNRSLMHRAFYCAILHVFQKLVYTYQLYAQNKQLRCLNQLVDRREGRGDTDVGVMRILLIRVGCPGTGHDNSGFLCFCNDRLCTAVQRFKGNKVAAVRLCPGTDLQIPPALCRGFPALLQIWDAESLHAFSSASRCRGYL